MKCPTCDNVNLAMTDRQGIEIDYCPQCRGIWLDRGELDGLIERAAPAAPAMPPTPPPAAPLSRDDHSPRDDRHHGYQPDYPTKRPRPEQSRVGNKCGMPGRSRFSPQPERQ